MRCILALVLLVFIASSLACAEETAPTQEPRKIAIVTTVGAREVRNYKVTVQITGEMPRKDVSGPLKLDLKYTLKVQHKYGDWDRDGLIPLDISMIEGESTTGGTSVALDNQYFPKLTLLVDRDWQVKSVFGTSVAGYERSKPGLNWVNMILLFYLYGANTPHAIGESWNAKAHLPVYKENYSFASTIKALEDLDGAKTVAVSQEITWTPQSEIESKCKASVQSNFALDNGKLIRSHADCDVEFVPSGDASKQQDTKAIRANIRIDITAV